MLILTRVEGEAIRYGAKSERLTVKRVGSDFIDIEELGCQAYDTTVDLAPNVTVIFKRREYQGQMSGQVQCLFNAPRSVQIDREEIWLQKQNRG